MNKTQAQMFHRHLPYFAEGEVIHGFGRGSKQLGVPTANFPDDVVGMLPPEMECGVYYGWASVDHGRAHKMVMSIGYNPCFNNTKKTMETHIMRAFDEDFYGSHLKILITGYIRPQLNFTSLGKEKDDSALMKYGAISSYFEHKYEQLIEAIRDDIQEAWNQLDVNDHQQLIDNHFFSSQYNGNINEQYCKDSNDNLDNLENIELFTDGNANCDMIAR